ncbi:MAG: type 1 glutamine amidotransferase domain-containing protein [Bermanella sp.]
MKKLFRSIAIISTSLILLLVTATSHASRDTRVLIVLTSHTELGNTGEKTGFWLPELTHPYYEFKKAGFTVDVASIQGGMAPLDSKAFDEADEYHQIFLNDAELMAKVMRSIPLSKINPDDYQAILFSGGSGPMWDFPDNKDINRISAAIYQSNGIVSAVCHGNAALINIKLADGSLLVKGKRVSAFSNEEEADLGTTEIIPFLLQDKLIERGAIYVQGKAWQENVVVADRLITGQNPASAKKVAQSIIERLQKS